MAPPTSCSGAYRMYRMLQHAWSLAPEGVTTPVLQQLQYGYQYDRKWNFSSLSWSARRSTTWHHRICQTNASSLPPPSAISFDHQTITITGTSSCHGDRAFAAAGPRLWKSLPTHVRQLDLSLDTFHHKLKMYFTV